MKLKRSRIETPIRSHIIYGGTLGRFIFDVVPVLFSISIFIFIFDVGYILCSYLYHQRPGLFLTIPLVPTHNTQPNETQDCNPAHPNTTPHNPKQPSATQPSTSQRNPTQPNPAQHNPTQHNTTHDPAQHNPTQPNPTQPNTTQPNTTQHNPTQPNTNQHNLTRPTQPNTTQHNPTQPNATNTTCSTLLPRWRRVRGSFIKIKSSEELEPHSTQTGAEQRPMGAEREPNGPHSTRTGAEQRPTGAERELNGNRPEMNGSHIGVKSLSNHVRLNSKRRRLNSQTRRADSTASTVIPNEARLNFIAAVAACPRLC